MTPEEIIAKVKDLPMVSETARKLPGLLKKPELHRDDLVKTLRCDNVLTAKLLRVCNSAHSGLREPVTSVDQAVMLLGDNTIFRMVCALGYGGAMGVPLVGYAVEANGLWSHSVTTGVAAEYLAEVENYGSFAPPLAFTAGLLHDIGKLILNQILTPKTRSEIRNLIAEKSMTRVEAEREVFGADHAAVGAVLLQRWNVPEVIVQAVADHHKPVVTPQIELSALVHLANCAAHLCGSSPGWDAYALRVQRDLSEALSLDVKRVEQLLLGVHGSLATVNQLMAAA
ncbi:MAG TPA: HDOD domain-containing protein [Verrucomicrobiae bacterium]|jgi:putative nucleotidyltransferase with HDIG domain|nr:HDOD domain-containing protein [Verrucomicrobiae bacterium]